MRLADYGAALRRYWIAILLMIAVGAAVGFGWAKLQTPVYEADASGFIKVASAADEEMYGPGQADGLAQSKVPTYLDMASWRTVATTAGEQLGVSTPPEVLVQRIAVTNPAGTAILKITAQGASPAEASDLASAWVNALAVEIDKVEGNGKAGSAPMTILLGESASLPTEPVFPDVKLAIIVGLVIGLGGGIAFALVRAIADRRLRSADDVEQRLDIPVAGTLPDVTGLSSGKRLYRMGGAGAKAQRADFAVRESLRMLRTNLQFMNVDDPPRKIVVTSALPGEGKSTVAANLAGALADSGQHVVLIDGDLRRPTVADSVDVDGSVGLTDVLAGRVEIASALQRVAAMPNLLVLPAGTLPPNPSELLGSERMRALLSELAEHATVIVDAPPLLAVTDGAVLTRQSDGALIVVSAGHTGYDVVDKAVDVLEKIHGHVLGVVLNKVPMSGGAYGGTYSYEYAAAAAGAKPEAAKPDRMRADSVEKIAARPTESIPASASAVPDAKPKPARTSSTRARRRSASAEVPAAESEEGNSLLDSLFDESAADATAAPDALGR